MDDVRNQACGGCKVQKVPVETSSREDHLYCRTDVLPARIVVLRRFLGGGGRPRGWQCNRFPAPHVVVLEKRNLRGSGEVFDNALGKAIQMAQVPVLINYTVA